MAGVLRPPIKSYKPSLKHTYVKSMYKGGLIVKEYIEERVRCIAEYVIEHGATVRQAAKVFGTSKSTVHKAMTERLCAISPADARKVAKILQKNKAERHIRGGNATRKKYRSTAKKRQA